MRAAKVDGNHREIVAALQAAGCSVQSLAMVGGGVPDLLVYRPGLGHLLIEVKDGAKSPSRRKLTEAQERWHAAWKGPVHVVTDVDSALEAVDVKMLATT